ncbi:hypothetical protein AAFF_G00310730 [Aldrovandia affinis]|uniref:ribonuclease H n=1 Tax=Aldrovandia affinis TaxID=143900 RepID=A0AAD7R824_9TELE|nr:hypothetical protein AAFF_G00310730 [Aldrovandia affinis]
MPSPNPHIWISRSTGTERAVPAATQRIDQLSDVGGVDPRGRQSPDITRTTRHAFHFRDFVVTIKSLSSCRTSRKTKVITPFGLFEFLRMPFGFKNATQAFQRLMDTVLRDLPCLFVYLDDILVASSSRLEHVSHLRTLFGLSTIDFLGRRLTKDRAVLPPSKVEAVRDLGPRRRFWACWSKEMTKAFTDTKQALANATTLVHPLANALIVLTTDASDYSVGAVHEQLVDGAWQPLASFSRQLRPNEQK